MNIEVKQLKDTQTGEVFVPLTHWDAVANKPEDIAKESTVVDKTQELQTTLNSINNNVTSSKDILNGKLGDIHNYLISRFDQVYSYLVSRFDQIHQFIANRADAILSQISLTRGDVTGAKSEILGKVGDVINRQSDFDNVNAARTRDVINTVNAQAQALSQQMLDNTNGVTQEVTNKILNELSLLAAIVKDMEESAALYHYDECSIDDINNMFKTQEQNGYMAIPDNVISSDGTMPIYVFETLTDYILY